MGLLEANAEEGEEKRIEDHHDARIMTKNTNWVDLLFAYTKYSSQLSEITIFRGARLMKIYKC
jgi:hypothetical protein